MPPLSTQFHPVTLFQVPVILILSLLCPWLLAASDNTGEAEQSDIPPPVFGLGWLDQTQSFASNFGAVKRGIKSLYPKSLSGPYFLVWYE